MLVVTRMARQEEEEEWPRARVYGNGRRAHGGGGGADASMQKPGARPRVLQRENRRGGRRESAEESGGGGKRCKSYAKNLDDVMLSTRREHLLSTPPRHTTQCVLPLMPRYMMCPNQEHQSPNRQLTSSPWFPERLPPTTYNGVFVGRSWAHGASWKVWRRARRPQQRYYEGPSPSSRQNRWRGGMRSMRDVYDGDGFQQTTRSDTHVGRNFHRNLRNDSPSSVRSLTPPTTRRFRSPSPGRRVTSPPPGN
ncbi:hypothetical protein HPB51_007265 [Rhipicephalus microplus]|uniref:Uncharacterized protein n=1 Tax=Rhipicephalus microplus TaxID=6941 RepID=A0A9J6DZN7_RHIMP|nr:hypothetical protein HPB51_007265 [Rhipicephalus microplus]